MRDLRQVGSKLKVVLLPREDHNSVVHRLKECASEPAAGPSAIFRHTPRSPLLRRSGDLWGPLLVCMMLSIQLSIAAPEDQRALVFAAVFVVVWAGAALVTVNAQLLGGTISFFQSVCILGYCIFPLNIAQVVCAIFKLMTGSLLLRTAIVGIGFVWSTRASVVFISEIIAPERRALAVYPVFFFYTFISWMVVIQ